MVGATAAAAAASATACLMARRLVEVGVPFVEVTLGGWDTHQDNFDRVKALSGQIDSPIAALIEDLKERGLLDSTLVVWMGEFGRTPNINARGAKPGRDHYPRAWSLAMWGGGIKGGRVIGKTDAEGAAVVEQKVGRPDFLATVCELWASTTPRRTKPPPAGLSASSTSRSRSPVSWCNPPGRRPAKHACRRPFILPQAKFFPVLLICSAVYRFQFLVYTSFLARVQPSPQSSVAEVCDPGLATGLTAGSQRIIHTPSHGVKAIISDIHSNLEALQAVLEDIDKHKRHRDLLPGRRRRLRPQPARVHRPGHGVQARPAGQPRPGGDVRPRRLQPARRAGHLLDARPARSRRREPRPAARTRWEFLAERPRSHRENGYLFVHGSARNPLNEYVFPEDIYNQRKMERIFALVERYCFQGHTHVPGVFTESLPRTSTSSTPRRDRLRLQARRPQDAVQRRLGRPAARRRLAGLLRPARRRHDPLPPRRVRHRDDDQEDLRHPRPGQLPRRPAPRRPLTISRDAKSSERSAATPQAPLRGLRVAANLLRRGWKPALALVIIALVARQFYRILDRPELNPYPFALRVEYLIPAGLLYLAAHACWAWFWLRLLRSQDIEVSFFEGLRAYFVSQYGKYIPGKVAVIAIRIAMLGWEGKAPAEPGAAPPPRNRALAVGVTATYETLISMGAGAIVGVLLLPWVEVMPDQLSRNLEFVFAVAALPLVLGVLNKLAARRIAKNARSGCPPLPSPPLGLLFQGLLQGAVGWCLLGISLCSSYKPWRSTLQHSRPMPTWRILRGVAFVCGGVLRSGRCRAASASAS